MVKSFPRSAKIALFFVIVPLAITIGVFVFSGPSTAQNSDNLDYLDIISTDKAPSEMTITQLREKIDQIKQAIHRLQMLLQAMPSSKQPLSISKIPPDYTFDNDLRYGTSSNEVVYLQVMLNQAPGTRVAESGWGSLGQESMYFGQKTLAAVKKFQEKYKEDILSPYHLNHGTGYVGQTTRQKLNELLAVYRTPAATPQPPEDREDQKTEQPIEEQEEEKKNQTTDPFRPQWQDNVIKDTEKIPDASSSSSSQDNATPKTLTVELKVMSPYSTAWTNEVTGQAPLNNVSLLATVFGTAAGDINYLFDCENDGSWDATYQRISSQMKSFKPGCSYQTGGIYTAKVRVQRNGLYAEDTAIITVESQGKSVCGNNVIEEGEVCDGTSLNSQTCQTQGYEQGTLTCALDCLSFNTNLCLPPEQTNTPPLLNAIGDKTINEGNTLSFLVTAHDPEDDYLTYSAQNGPTGSTFRNQTFTFTPTFQQAGTYTVTFTVSDGEYTDSDTITITVNDVCQPDTCASLGHECGTYSDGCSATIDCGTCDSGYQCQSGTCIARAVCGDGTCNGSETCDSCPDDCGSCPTLQGDYYVAMNDPACSDAGPGTRLQPWCTLGRAYSSYNGSGPKVREGDTVLFRDGDYGTFQEDSRDHGTPYYRTDWIIYKAAPGYSPNLTSISIYNKDLWAAKGDGDSYLHIEGFNVADGAVIDSASYVKLVDCNIVTEPIGYSGQYAPYFDNTGLLIRDCTQITIQDCNIHRCWRGIDLEGSGSYVTLKNNNIYHTAEDGIEASGYSYQTIEENTITNINKYRTFIEVQGSISGSFLQDETISQASTGAMGIVYNPSYQADKILVCEIGSDHFLDAEDGGGTITGQSSGATISSISKVDPRHTDAIQFNSGNLTNVTIRKNFINRGNWRSDSGFQGIKFGPVGTTYTDFVLENNVIWANKPIHAERTMTHIKINNNTFCYYNDAGEEGNGFSSPKNLTATEMYNNIFMTTGATEADGLNITAEGNNITSNLVSNWNNVFTDWANGDFSLKADSIAVDYGNSNYGPSTDIEGNQRDANPDAGAYEY